MLSFLCSPRRFLMKNLTNLIRALDLLAAVGELVQEPLLIPSFSRLGPAGSRSQQGEEERREILDY
jgi:hypothetical protein